MRRQRWILVAIVAGYGLLCGRAVGYDFVWDDVPEIARAEALDGPLLDALRMTQVDRIDPVLAHTPGVVLAYDSYREHSGIYLVSPSFSYWALAPSSREAPRRRGRCQSPNREPETCRCRCQNPRHVEGIRTKYSTILFRFRAPARGRDSEPVL